MKIVDRADIIAECGHVGRSHISFGDIERERDIHRWGVGGHN